MYMQIKNGYIYDIILICESDASFWRFQSPRIWSIITRLNSRYINDMFDAHSAGWPITFRVKGLQRRRLGYIHGPINLLDVDSCARNNRVTLHGR